MTRRGTLGVAWGLLLTACAIVATPASAQVARGQPKVTSWQAADPARPQHFGILGEVARPGVYQAANRSVTLQELVRQAGGVTAAGSPGMRIVRQGRSAQTVFFNAAGQDLLQPHDVIVVDALKAVRQGPETGTASSAATAPAGVWVCFLGVTDRPVIVPLDPDKAQLSYITQMLGQSRELARSVRTILPPRTIPLASPDAIVPTGSVLCIDSGLLVAGNLPSFPESISLDAADAVAASPIIAPAAAPTVLPPGPLLSDPSWSTTLASQPRQAVNATPVPFSSSVDVPTNANPASLPAPGSRVHPLEPTKIDLPPAPTGPTPRSVNPKILADRKVEVMPSAETTEFDVPPEPKSSALSIWQMFGVSGTVAFLVGIAIASRQYFDPQATVPALPPEFEPIGAVLQSSPITEPPVVEAAPLASVREPAPSEILTQEPDDLDEILRGGLPIVTEAIVFPQRFPLQRQRQPDRTSYRLDAAQKSALPAPHVLPEPAMARSGAPADRPESVVPRPHLLKQPSSAPIASQTSEVFRDIGSLPPSTDQTSEVSEDFRSRSGVTKGTSLERALSQIQGGPRS